jgi:hypothetical protein
MENVVRELDTELYNYVVNYVYETYEYLITLKEAKEYVKIIMVDLINKDISLIKQGDFIKMVCDLIVKDAKELIIDNEKEITSKTNDNSIVFEDRYSLIFKNAYNKLNENEQSIINDAFINKNLDSNNETFYLNTVIKLVNIIMDDDVYIAKLVLNKMININCFKNKIK